MAFFAELKRRNVIRMGAAYLVVAWLLIQVSDIVFPRLGLPDWTVTFVIALLALGFPAALFFAWAFELTPEGLKKEKDVERAASITPQTGRKLDRLVIVVLVLALGFFSIDRFVLEPARDAEQQRDQSDRLAEALEEARKAAASEQVAAGPDGKSIAVLAFDDMSPDKDQEYLSDGIAEELLNLLAKVPELRVISRSSAFSYKGKDIKLAQVAEELNVAHILEGSVRKAGNRVRITAQLIEARSDTHLWSETYDRTLDDVFAIQDEIAATVVAQLKVKLLGEAPHVEETDPEAYTLFLQARHLGRLGTEQGWEQSNALYEQALAIDPNYADAWNALATNHINMASRGLLPWDEGYDKAREAVEKALAIDPGHAPAHDNLGFIAMVYDADLAQAARHYERALQLDPSNLVIMANGASLLLYLGRLEEAIAAYEYFAARDPVDPARHANLAWNYFTAGRWDEAIASIDTTLRLSPGYIGAHFLKGEALLLKGEPEAALADIQAESFAVFRLVGLAQIYHALGRTADSDAALAELIEKHENEWSFSIARVLAYRGEVDRAFEWLDKAVDYGDAGLSEIFLYLQFQSLHDDPRWPALLERIGRTQEQLDAIEFEVKLPR